MKTHSRGATPKIMLSFSKGTSKDAKVKSFARVLYSLAFMQFSYPSSSAGWDILDIGAQNCLFCKCIHVVGKKVKLLIQLLDLC